MSNRSVSNVSAELELLKRNRAHKNWLIIESGGVDEVVLNLKSLDEFAGAAALCVPRLPRQDLSQSHDPALLHFSLHRRLADRREGSLAHA